MLSTRPTWLYKPDGTGTSDGTDRSVAAIVVASVVTGRPEAHSSVPERPTRGGVGTFAEMPAVAPDPRDSATVDARLGEPPARAPDPRGSGAACSTQRLEPVLLERRYATADDAAP